MGFLKEKITKANPTATHHFLKKLANMKKLTRVYTQNIDNLEEPAGLLVDWKLEKVTKYKGQVVQLHGSMERLRCMNCTNDYPFETHYCGLFKQGDAPRCPNCEERGTYHVKTRITKFIKFIKI
ncbi:hypothetical protein Glove_22g121 [Diversispora epigaea]|uniref:Deacetylase sirtuin-type domain-containing protein n=1 Tax=Diversispora epigaea TaxID=1348612 RepID=A0A397JTM4_9GLOM|nr:hypothetical protein Glove_22g121 [Diversispora epigaea]